MEKKIVAVVYSTGEVEVVAPTSIGVLLVGADRLRNAVQQMGVMPAPRGPLEDGEGEAVDHDLV
jgi:hypothetical protein